MRKKLCLFAVLLVLLAVLPSCSQVLSEPCAPVTEMSGESCTITYGGNTYKATVTHLMQGVTTVCFKEPDAVSGLTYNFTGNGCEITLGELTLKTDVSLMGAGALPGIIHDIFTGAQTDGALTFTGTDTPNASTLTTATFVGECDGVTYEITTDRDSGVIREITAQEYDLTLRFAAK